MGTGLGEEPIGIDAPAARLRALVEEQGRAVQSLLLGLERDASVREELWSDVFTLAFRRLDELEPLTAAQRRRWLLRATRNLTANAARRSISRRRAVQRLLHEPVALAVSAEEAYFATTDLAAHQQEVAEVYAAWQQLSPAHREVLALDALGLKGPAIAREIGVSNQAARSRLMRARQALLDAHTTGAPT